jgi:hypothetical protein
MSTTAERSGIASNEKPKPEIDCRAAATQIMTITANRSLIMEKL